MTSQYAASASLLDKTSSLCDCKSSIQARFTLASYSENTSCSNFLEKLLLFFEYFQLVTPLIIVTISLNFSPDSSLFKAILFLARIVNPAYWMSFDKTGALENTVLGLVCLLTLTKLLLFAYVMYQCSRSTDVKGIFVTIWRFIMKFQSRVAYFYVSSFYVSSVLVVNWETFIRTEDQSLAWRIVAFVLIAFELLLALIPLICYHNILPTDSFLSSKNNHLERLLLLQKVIVQVLTSTLDLYVMSSYWIITVINLVIDFLRIFNFFYTLPLYSFAALRFQGWLLMVLASLNLSCFVTVVTKEIDENYGSLVYSLIIWGVLLLLSIKVSNSVLKRAFWKLVCDPSLDSPALLAHRIVAIQELRKNTKAFLERNETYDYSLLMNKTLNSHIKRILWVDDEKKNTESLDINNKDSANIIFKNYLEKLREKFPRNRFLQIFIAEFYFKHTQLYGDPIKICLNLKSKSRNMNLRINAELLLIRLQNQMKTKYQMLENTQLDLLNFICEHTFIAKLKQEMLEQVNLQIGICSEIMKPTPDLEIIHMNSQKANHHRKLTMKKINRIASSLSDWNIEPIIMSAEYYLAMNHSVTDYVNFTKIYSQKLSKYQKYFSQEKCCLQNIFQENVAFYVVSGEKGKAGTIIYGTKQVEAVLGGDYKQCPGADINMRTPPIFRPVYIEAWRKLSENPETSYFGKISRGLKYHLDDYLVEVEYFLDMHPFTTQGFHFVFVFRPVYSEREFLLLHENGDIDSASKGIMEKLGLSPQNSQTNILALNEELAVANEAFNMIAYPEKYKGDGIMGMASGLSSAGGYSHKKFILTKSEAEEIYNRYTTSGVNITLSSLDRLGVSYVFTCKMKNEIYGSLLIKTITFEENKKETYKDRTNDWLTPLNSPGKNRTWRDVSPGAGERTPKGLDLSRSLNTLMTEEEKQEGWIDFEALTTTRRSQLEVQSPLSPPETESQRGGDDSMNTTDRRLLPAKTNKSKFYVKRFDDKDSGLARHPSNSTHEVPTYKDHDLDQLHHKANIATMATSKMSQQKKISSVFHASLDTKYHSRTLKGLVGVLYISVCILTILRIVLKTTLDKQMDSLVAKKDIFSNNGFRSYNIIEVSWLIRTIWQFYTDEMNLHDFPADFQTNFYMTQSWIVDEIADLRDINRIVLTAASILNSETQQSIFQKNVKVYDTYFDEAVQTFTLMDSFQTTDRLVEVALDLYHGFFSPDAGAEAATQANFIFRNSLNDLIVMNNQLSETLLSSFNDQYDDMRHLTLGFMILFVILTGLVFGVFCLFLYKQYSADVLEISAVCRLSHMRVQNVHKQFVNFKKYLQQEDENDIGKSLPTFHYKQQAKTREDTSISSTHLQREPIKTPIKKGVGKRYLKHIFWTAVLLLILILLVVEGGVRVISRLKEIKEIQGHLYFINDIRIDLTLASATYRELTATNNVAYVENQKALTEMEELIKTLGTRRTEIYSILLVKDVLENIPEVKTILLDDGCKLLDDSEYNYYCKYLEAKETSRGLISLMTQFGDYITDNIAAYKASDKSEAALDALQYIDFLNISPLVVVAGSEVDVLWDIMNKGFEAKVEEDMSSRRQGLAVFLVVVVLIGIIGWFWILRKLGEGVNEFKNVLRVFPAEVVLSSFILKKFLMKTSNEALDHIRNELH